MESHRFEKIVFALALLATALALVATLVIYLRNGEIEIRTLAGGLFLLSIALGAYGRMRKSRSIS